jgi:hypothetical protein
MDVMYRQEVGTAKRPSPMSRGIALSRFASHPLFTYGMIWTVAEPGRAIKIFHSERIVPGSLNFPKSRNEQACACTL